MITKVTSRSNNTNSVNVDYKSTGKPAMSAPKILESYLNDDGEIVHILDNNRETLDVAYMAMWGQPKTAIITTKNYKGKDFDGRRSYL